MSLTLGITNAAPNVTSEESQNQIDLGSNEEETTVGTRVKFPRWLTYDKTITWNFYYVKSQ